MCDNTKKFLHERMARREAKDSIDKQDDFRLEWALAQERRTNERLYRSLRQEEKRNQELSGALETSRRKCRETKAKLLNKTLSEEIELRSIKNTLPCSQNRREVLSSSAARAERAMITLWYIDSTGRQLVRIYKDTPISMPLMNFREKHPNTFSKAGPYSHGGTFKFRVPLILDEDTPESLGLKDYDEITVYQTCAALPEVMVEASRVTLKGLTAQQKRRKVEAK